MSLRQLTNIARAPLTPRHYLSLARSVIYKDWINFFLRRFILEKGAYPYECIIRAPTGDVCLTLYGTGDAFTVNEIFGLNCYAIRDEKVIVDFGSNIGISAAYFLTRNPKTFVYCFEPLPENFGKLLGNLRPFRGRYEAQQVAVMHNSEGASFFTEPSGRLSGFDCTEGEWRTFPSVGALDTLRHIAREHGRIDLLKIDVEGAERLFLPTLTEEILQKIGSIYIETQQNPVIPGFTAKTSISGVRHYRR